MATRCFFSASRPPLVAVVLSIFWASFAQCAGPATGSTDPGPSLSIELIVLEVPADVARRFALEQRLAELGLVLSNAEAAKLAELSLKKPETDATLATLAQTWVGRSAVLRGAAGARTVACVVLPEGASSDGDITLRVAPLPASRSPLEIAANDHETMFALSRTSAVVQLRRGESMMFGGWKVGKDQANTVLAIVKPRLLDSAAPPVATASRSSMSTMRLGEARIGTADKPADGPKVAREVAAADSPAAASPGPVVPGTAPPPPSPPR